MLAEMVYDTGEIIWTVVLSIISLALLGLMASMVSDLVRDKLDSDEYFTVIAVMTIPILVVAIPIGEIVHIPSERAQGLAITRDLEKQGFCVESVSSEEETALICTSEGFIYEVEVIKQGDQWVVKNGSQRLNQAPTAASTTTRPLRPDDLQTTEPK